MSKSALIKSSLAKKYWMAGTGLFLCLFLLGHLAGNLQLLIPASEGARDTFNEYALFMTTNPVVMILSYVTYASILFHAIDGLLLVFQNRKARPKKYAHNKQGAGSSWASRNMGLLGAITLVFIILHMKTFWYEMKFGSLPMYTTEGGAEVKDLYTLVVEFYNDPSMGLVFTLFYVISMLVIAFHLAHGVQSAFQSMGIRHKKYTPIITKAGMAFAVIIPLLFAIIPLVLHFR